MTNKKSINYDSIKWIASEDLETEGYQIFAEMLAEATVKKFQAKNISTNSLCMLATNADVNTLKMMHDVKTEKNGKTINGIKVLLAVVKKFNDDSKDGKTIKILLRDATIEPSNDRIITRWLELNTDGSFVAKK